MIRQGPRYRHKIYEGQLCALLEVDAKGLDKLIRRHNFPHQADSDKNGAYWPVSAVRHWISTAQYRPLRSLLPVWWPDATEPATYRGAEPVRYRRNDLKPAAVLQHWRTSYGANIVVCWPMIGHTTTVVGGYLSEWAPEADAYVAIGTDFGLYGTDVWAKRGDWQGDSEDLAWADLARVLGQPAPFWPDSLRAPQLIQQWSPGAEPVAHHGESPLDTAPLLRMAALYPVGHPVHGAMMHTAQAIQRAAVATESPGIKRIHARIDQGRLTAEQITVAATPMPACEPEDVPETTLRIGWREVLHREDWLAFECVNILHAKNGGKNLPHAYTIEIEHTAAGEEFLARLEPTPRRAEFAILDPDRTATPMFDPLTDTPVIINRSDARILALAPERLPATSPLAEIILDNTIWVRTQDGTLYPAPRNSTYGLSWGYGGGGPRTLAALIVQLLDDITAPGAKPNTDEPLPHDLLRLLEHKWPNGTVLTRARLETACNGSR